MFAGPRIEDGKYGNLISPYFLVGKVLTCLEECQCFGGQSRPIKEQGSGFGGGRVLIIGGLGGGKLRSFVLNSGVPHGVDGFPYCFSGNNINITSP